MGEVLLVNCIDTTRVVIRFEAGNREQVISKISLEFENILFGTQILRDV